MLLKIERKEQRCSCSCGLAWKNGKRKMPKLHFKVPVHTFFVGSIVCMFVLSWHHSTTFDSFFESFQANPGDDEISLVSMMNKPKPNLHRKFVPVPEQSRKLFWVRKDIHYKLYEPVIRAFHSRGYSLTKDFDRAHILWSDHPFSKLYNNTKPWQRNSWVPNIRLWDDKDSMAYHMNEYYAKKGEKALHSFPESYLLHKEDDLRRFQQRLQEGGINDPWVLKAPTVNQGKGIKIVGPNSTALQEIMMEKKAKDNTRKVAQKYICDEMTYFGRKFDYRIFWMVASVDPLIVLYQTKHNYVRIGAAIYDETNFTNTRSHLTTHTFGANEGKATWDEFRIYIEEFHALQGDRLSHIEHPFQHLENQVKQVLSHLADAFKNMTYHSRGISAENAFTWHAADMILDNDLDVYIIEGTDGPGKDEDYDFRIVMHNVVFGDMIDIVEEVARRQELGQPVDVQEMEQDGILGSYEVVYNDGWMFQYTFDRLEKKGCSASADRNIGSAKIEVPNEILDVIQEKAHLTARPKGSANATAKTFYMEGRADQAGEPIARSLRSKGWVPVDNQAAAQLVYEKVASKNFPNHLEPWQTYNHIPQEKIIFTLLQGAETRTRACDPLLFKGRGLSVNVFWLVLSLDPLVVFYHDGFLHIPYNVNDENEFILQNQDHSLQYSNKSLVWRGSWISFDHLLRNTTVNDPMNHVKGQIKRYLVTAAKELKRVVMERDLYSRPHSFGIYMAEFNVDRNLHVMEPFVSTVEIYTEGYQEMVDLHDDVFGSAFNLVEKFNSTGTNVSAALDSVRSGYELILDGERGWEFEYIYYGQPKQCLA